MERSNLRLVVCLSNEAYCASLEMRKLYVVVPDAEAESSGLLRVIDESGEDYLYPAEHFADVEIPDSVAEALGLSQ